jgi:transcriptional regulator with XRE-family HTH domain
MHAQISYAEWSLQHYLIGPKLRALRRTKRLTLARLATQTGRSAALLSKLETDRLIATLPTLAVICKVYGVGLSHFFCEPERHSMSVTRKVQLEGKFAKSDAVKPIPLNVQNPKFRLSSEMVEINPESPFSLSKPNCDTSAVVFVLDGRLEVRSGAMMEVLETGDLVHIESSLEMFWNNPGSTPAVFWSFGLRLQLANSRSE